MATIKEIAELAGVSRGTVDRVLNNRGAVNDDTAKRVLTIAKSLDYRPNRAGIVLAAQKKKLKLGVIIFSTENYFFADVLSGVEEKAKELADYNCSVIVRQVYHNIDQQLQALKELVEEGVNGIAITPCNHPSIQEYIDTLFENRIPVVTLNTDIEGSKRMAYVGSHYRHSGETAAGLMQLLTHGKANIGIVSGSPDVLCHTERVAGFCSTIKEHYPNLHIADMVENHDDETESYEKTTLLLKEHPDIDALFITAGGTYGACQAVKALGLAGKLKIVSYDKAPFTQGFLEDGTLCAVICQRPQLQGSRPLEILFDYLTTGEPPHEEHHYMDVVIRIRENLNPL